MSFLDSVVGAVSSQLGGAQGNAGLLQAGMALIEQHGGVQAIISKLQEGGLASEVASWVGTGANQAISGDKLQQVLGSDMVKELAGKFGMNPATLSAGLAAVLPQLIDKATPNGAVADNHSALLQEGMSALMGAFGGSSKPAA